jgi:hypothetical protein
MKKQYKKFVFGETLQKAILQIPESEQLRFYRIIVEYGIDGIEPTLDGFESAVWVQMKDMIDNTMPAKRGAPEGNKNAKNKKNNSDQIDLIVFDETIQDELNELKQINQLEKDENKCANDNDNVNVKDNDNEEFRESPGEKNSSSSSSAVISKSEKTEIAPKSEPPSDPDPHPPDRQLQQTSPPFPVFGDAASVWEKIRGAWNDHNCRFTCDKIFLNLSYDQRERVRGSMATYTPDQMVRAIDQYFEEREKKPDGYEYKSFYLFVEKGMEFYVEG